MYRMLEFFVRAIVVVACVLTSQFAFAEELLVGLAEADITPPVGFPMAGYYHERLADGQRDPLQAKAVVLRQGNVSAAFVVADLTGVARDLYKQVVQQASAATGISEQHIVLSATHSHTAPDYSGQLYSHLKKAADDRDANSYSQKLIDGCVSALVTANSAAQPASIVAGRGQQKVPVAFNRRFVMKDGSVKTWQSYTSSDVLRAAGPIDPEVGLLAFKSADGEKTVGVVSNFALHLDTVGGTQWSGDYPYYIEQSLRKRFGEKMTSVFGLGCCGDINHSNPNAKERNKTDFIGNAIADTINAALPDLKPVKETRLQVRSTTVNLPMPEVTQHELSRAEELIPIARAGGKVAFFDLVSAYKAVVQDQLQNKTPRTDCETLLSWGLSHEWRGIGKTLPVDVTTITIGRDVAIVFLPGEVFVELGLAIKQASPYSTTMIFELSNCVETMYIPTRAAYAGGSYEVTNSAVEPGSGEMLVEAALTLLRESASAE